MWQRSLRPRDQDGKQTFDLLAHAELMVVSLAHFGIEHIIPEAEMRAALEIWLEC